MSQIVNWEYYSSLHDTVKNEDFEYYCLTDMPEMLDKFKGMGIRQVPVVYKGDTLVGGFRELKKALAQ